MYIITAVIICMILPLIIIYVFRRFVLLKRNVPAELFAEALRNENSGHFESALVNYERALEESKKNRFYSTSMRNKIIEKLKVLHTVIAYRNNSHYDRCDNG